MTTTYPICAGPGETCPDCGFENEADKYDIEIPSNEAAVRPQPARPRLRNPFNSCPCAVCQGEDLEEAYRQQRRLQEDRDFEPWSGA